MNVWKKAKKQLSLHIQKDFMHSKVKINIKNKLGLFSILLYVVISLVSHIFRREISYLRNERKISIKNSTNFHRFGV